MVEPQPTDQPSNAEDPGKYEGPTPSQFANNDRHEQWSNYGADVRTGVENASCECTFTFGKPFRDGFDRGREVGGFSKSQHEPCESESEDALSQRVAHGGEAPDADG